MVVNDVSRELDNDRDKARAWKKQVKDKSNCIAFIRYARYHHTPDVQQWGHNVHQALFV
jgi:hypothetical protein